MWPASAEGDIRVIRFTHTATGDDQDGTHGNTNRIRNGSGGNRHSHVHDTRPGAGLHPEGGGGTGTGCTYTPTGSGGAADSETPWLKIALGAAGGVALVGAGAATVSSRNRRQHHQAHPA